MANSLLDFVMSLVRDPDAAARYAADPTQAIADANLTGVTSADHDRRRVHPCLTQLTSTVTLVGLVMTSKTAERFCDCATSALISSAVALASIT